MTDNLRAALERALRKYDAPIPYADLAAFVLADPGVRAALPASPSPEPCPAVDDKGRRCSLLLPHDGTHSNRNGEWASPSPEPLDRDALIEALIAWKRQDQPDKPLSVVQRWAPEFADAILAARLSEDS